MRLFIVALIPLLACGPKAGTDDDGGGTGEGSANDDADSVGDDGVSLASSADDDGGDDSTSAANCEMYQPDPDIGPEVTIAVRHEGSAPAFVQPYGCGGPLVFEIVDAGGNVVPYVLDSECSPNTCDGFIASTDCSVACNDCAAPTAARIDPGAAGDGRWPGRRTTELGLSPACAPTSECPATCLRPEQAPPGTYEIRLVTYRTCTGPCECEGGPSTGVCPLYSGEQLSDSIVFAVTIDYPSQTSAEITITD